MHSMKKQPHPMGGAWESIREIIKPAPGIHVHPSVACAPEARNPPGPGLTPHQQRNLQRKSVLGASTTLRDSCLRLGGPLRW